MLTRLPFALCLFALTRAAAQTELPAPTPAPVATSAAPVAAPPAPASAVPAPVPTISGVLITNKGPLVGGAIRLEESGQICVTNGEGEFYFRLLYKARTQAAVISYSGGADVPVTLVAGPQPAPIIVPDPTVTKASAKALKKALKYGRKQGRKQARKSR